MKEKLSIWLIGPSSCGKTAVSEILYTKIYHKLKKLVLFDGKELRQIFKRKGYDPKSRSNNIRQYAALVKLLIKNDISTILTSINAFENDRIFCRKEIVNYKEIYLKCSLAERIKRDKKKIYSLAIKGEKKYVVDVDIPFEEPKNSDLIINSEINTPEEIADEIIKKLNL